jgi:hypothetical protein
VGSEADIEFHRSPNAGLPQIVGTGPRPIEHTIITTAWHILSTNTNTNYHDLGGDHHLRRNPDRARHRAIRSLNQLGYTVTFNPIQAAA